MHTYQVKLYADALEKRFCPCTHQRRAQVEEVLMLQQHSWHYMVILYIQA